MSDLLRKKILSRKYKCKLAPQFSCIAFGAKVHKYCSKKDILLGNYNSLCDWFKAELQPLIDPRDDELSYLERVGLNAIVEARVNSERANQQIDENLDVINDKISHPGADGVSSAIAVSIQPPIVQENDLTGNLKAVNQDNFGSQPTNESGENSESNAESDEDEIDYDLIKLTTKEKELLGNALQKDIARYFVLVDNERQQKMANELLRFTLGIVSRKECKKLCLPILMPVANEPEAAN